MKPSFKVNFLSLWVTQLSVRLTANLVNARNHAASEHLAGAIYSPTQNFTCNTEQLFQSCIPNCTNIISSQGCWKQQFCHLSAYSHLALVQAQMFVKPRNDPERTKLWNQSGKNTKLSLDHFLICTTMHAGTSTGINRNYTTNFNGSAIFRSLEVDAATFHQVYQLNLKNTYEYQKNSNNFT